jgi:2-methylcitrate dehydratase PrpD
LTNGQTITRFVEQSLGNIKRPLSDAQLEDKFRDQAVPKLGRSKVDKLIGVCWKFDELKNLDALIEATQ